MLSLKLLFVIFLSFSLRTLKGNIVSIVERDQQCYDGDCYHGGKCEEGACTCPSGWEGNYCQHCQGRFLEDSLSGTIQDSEYDKGHFNDCGWLIRLNSSSNETNPTLHLDFEDASAACDGDFLYVYDGDGIHSPLLASFDGTTTYHSPVISGSIVASSGMAFLHFKSETEVRREGYTVNYWFNDDAPELPSNESPYASLSSYGWTEYLWKNLTSQGRASAAAVMNDENLYVFGGRFLGETKYQQKMLKFDSSWRVDVVDSSSEPSSRFGHSMISFKDQLIVFGGLIVDTYSISNEIWSFNTTNGQWSQVLLPVETMTTPSPSEEGTTPFPSSHMTLPLVDVTSSLPDGNISKTSRDRFNELIKILSTKSPPEKTSPTESVSENVTDNLMTPTTLTSSSTPPAGTTIAPPLFGHTSHFVQLRNGRNLMIVLFGFHARWGFSNFVFEYSLDNSTWSRVETSGAIPHGGYGHASALDEVNNLIYVHGGFKVQSSYEGEMLIYDVEVKAWSRLAPAHPRYLHSMVLINGSLLLYGGRSFEGHGILCEDAEFAKYDIATDSWKTLDLYITPSYSRFGHSSLTPLNRASDKQATMIVYGGYDGTMLSDVMTYVMDLEVDCSSLGNNTSCNHPMCQWKDGACQDLSCAEGEELTFFCDYFCSSFSTCSTCLSTALSCCSCSFCPNCSQTCFYGSDNSSLSDISQCNDDDERMNLLCRSFTNCEQCNVMDGCTWIVNHCTFSDSPSSQCPPSCLDQTNCSVCLSVTGCRWCETTGTCVDQSATDVFYPYGTCTDWKTDECVDPCLSHISCDDCSGDLGCGWCATDVDTGTGTCMSGSSHAPLGNSTCSSGHWFFLTCPECQCNGHSSCSEGSDVCNNCTDHTMGETCEMCEEGYYGYPLNGANCSACDCNGHSDDCNNAGWCNCRVNGMTGKSCDGCFESKNVKYSGDPENGTCYYNIQVQYRYTFQITDPYITEMNFVACPMIRDDILMKIQSDYDILFDADIRYNYTGPDNTSTSEQPYKLYENQTFLSLIFRQDEFNFGGQPRCCLHIYLKFKAPFFFYISLERTQNYLSLLLGVFFASFLILLIIALVWWKLHDFVYRFRYRRRREIELQEMAARPFATIDFDFAEKIPLSDENLDVIADEMSVDERVSVVSVLMKMPSITSSGANNREAFLSLATTLTSSSTGKSSATQGQTKKKENSSANKQPTGFFNLAIDLENDLDQESLDSTA